MSGGASRFVETYWADYGFKTKLDFVDMGINNRPLVRGNSLTNRAGTLIEYGDVNLNTVDSIQFSTTFNATATAIVTGVDY